MIKQTNSYNLNWHQIVASGIVAFAFFMSLLVSERVFERLPHLEDEVAYLYQARIFAGGQVVIDSPQPSNAYWQPFVVDYAETGQRFSKYTPGWSAILALGVAWGYPQIINAILAGLTVALVYRLGREVFNADVGVIASLLVAFSPAALLLNATLMSHTAGLFLTTLFIYAYWRLERNKHPHLWGLVAGLALGMLASTRPLTTLGIALPFIAWSGVRLLWVLIRSPLAQARWQVFIGTLTPLLVLSAGALVLASSIPAYSYVATGDPQQNLYELVWEYDRIGFGEAYGRNGHRIEKGFNHARFDLSLTASDLFGWQFEPINEAMITHLQEESDYYEGRGYSFILLIPGLLLGLLIANPRPLSWQIIAVLIWGMISYVWVWFPQNLDSPLLTTLGIPPTLASDPIFSWVWVIVALLWLFLPLLGWYILRDDARHIPYTWLFFALIGSVVIVQMLYWIGSQRYSTRYYYEALSASALLTALPLAWVIGRGRLLIGQMVNVSSAWRWLSYGALLILCLFTLYNYSTPRIMALYQFNGISQDLIQQVQAQRVDDRPLLVIVNGASSGENRVRWRSYAPLMAVTSPYLDSEIVAVRDYGGSRQQFIEQYPDRQVVDVFAAGNDANVVSSSPDS